MFFTGGMQTDCFWLQYNVILYKRRPLEYGAETK